MPSGRYGRDHQRARQALLAQIQWGVTPCCRCGHPLMPGDRVDLDHADDGSGDYLGFSHHSACFICRQKCNQRAGGQLGALRQGKQLAERRCVVCGMPFTAGGGTTGAAQASCGQQACITELRRRRRGRQDDGTPPPSSGRVW
jgi:hypothetical protein